MPEEDEEGAAAAAAAATMAAMPSSPPPQPPHFNLLEAPPQGMPSPSQQIPQTAAAAIAALSPDADSPFVVGVDRRQLYRHHSRSGSSRVLSARISARGGARKTKKMSKVGGSWSSSLLRNPANKPNNAAGRQDTTRMLEPNLCDTTGRRRRMQLLYDPERAAAYRRSHRVGRDAGHTSSNKPTSTSTTGTGGSTANISNTPRPLLAPPSSSTSSSSILPERRNHNNDDGGNGGGNDDNDADLLILNATAAAALASAAATSSMTFGEGRGRGSDGDDAKEPNLVPLARRDQRELQQQRLQVVQEERQQANAGPGTGKKVATRGSPNSDEFRAFRAAAESLSKLKRKGSKGRIVQTIADLDCCRDNQQDRQQRDRDHRAEEAEGGKEEVEEKREEGKDDNSATDSPEWRRDASDVLLHGGTEEEEQKKDENYVRGFMPDTPLGRLRSGDPLWFEKSVHQTQPYDVRRQQHRNHQRHHDRQQQQHQHRDQYQQRHQQQRQSRRRHHHPASHRPPPPPMSIELDQAGRPRWDDGDGGGDTDGISPVTDQRMSPVSPPSLAASSVSTSSSASARARRTSRGGRHDEQHHNAHHHHDSAGRQQTGSKRDQQDDDQQGRRQRPGKKPVSPVMLSRRFVHALTGFGSSPSPSSQPPSQPQQQPPPASSVHVMHERERQASYTSRDRYTNRDRHGGRHHNHHHRHHHHHQSYSTISSLDAPYHHHHRGGRNKVSRFDREQLRGGEVGGDNYDDDADDDDDYSASSRKVYQGNAMLTRWIDLGLELAKRQFRAGDAYYQRGEYRRAKSCFLVITRIQAPLEGDDLLGHKGELLRIIGEAKVMMLRIDARLQRGSDHRTMMEHWIELGLELAQKQWRAGNIFYDIGDLDAAKQCFVNVAKVQSPLLNVAGNNNGDADGVASGSPSQMELHMLIGAASQMLFRIDEVKAARDSSVRGGGGGKQQDAHVSTNNDAHASIAVSNNDDMSRQSNQQQGGLAKAQETALPKIDGTTGAEGAAWVLPNNSVAAKKILRKSAGAPEDISPKRTSTTGRKAKADDVSAQDLHVKRAQMAMGIARILSNSHGEGQLPTPQDGDQEIDEKTLDIFLAVHQAFSAQEGEAKGPQKPSADQNLRTVAEGYCK